MSKHEEFVERAVAEMQAKREAHDALWHFSEAAWSVDQDAGTLTFTLPDGVTAVCPLQIIGTYNIADGTWLWGWDHPSVVQAVAEHAKQTLAYGKKNRLENLTTRKVECDENAAWEFTALACKLNEAQGAYCGASGPTQVYMTYGVVTLSGKPKAAKKGAKKPTTKKPAEAKAKVAKPKPEAPTDVSDTAGTTAAEDRKLLANPRDAVRAFIQMSCDWETKAQELSEAEDELHHSDEEAYYKLRAKNEELIAKGYENLIDRFCVATVGRKWQCMSFPPTHDPVREVIVSEKIKDDQAAVRSEGTNQHDRLQRYEYRFKKFGDVWRLWSIREYSERNKKWHERL